MNVVQGQTALCHAVSCHRAVDAAGQHIQGAAAGAHGQTTLTRYFRAVNIRTVIPDLHNDLELGVLHIHPQVVVQPQQVSAQFPHQLRAGHGVGLIGTAGLHLEGLDAVQAVAQILLRSPADGVKVLFADHGTAQRRQTEHGAHPVKGQIHVHVLFFGLHIKGRLGAVHLELAHGLEPVAQDLHHGRLELVAVEAFQGHFALIAQNDLMHKCCTPRVTIYHGRRLRSGHIQRKNQFYLWMEKNCGSFPSTFSPIGAAQAGRFFLWSGSRLLVRSLFTF